MSHYETLGVPRDASATEIKRAFRKLASQHHPDRGGDKEKSAAVNDAYACLSDSERRARYDASGEDRPAGPSPEDQRRLEVQQTLVKAIEESLNHPEVESRRLIFTTRGRIDGALDAARQQEDKIAAARKMLEKLLKKMRRKAGATGDDLVAMLMAGKLGDLERALDVNKHAIGVLGEAREMLDAYEEDAAAPTQATTHQSDVIRQIEGMMFQRFGRF